MADGILTANDGTTPASDLPIPVTLKTWVGFATMCIGMFMAILGVQVVAKAINDAWATVALMTLAVIVVVPFARTPVWRLIVTVRNGRVFVPRERH